VPAAVEYQGIYGLTANQFGGGFCGSGLERGCLGREVPFGLVGRSVVLVSAAGIDLKLGGVQRFDLGGAHCWEAQPARWNWFSSPFPLGGGRVGDGGRTSLEAARTPPPPAPPPSRGRGEGVRTVQGEGRGRLHRRCFGRTAGGQLAPRAPPPVGDRVVCGTLKACGRRLVRITGPHLPHAFSVPGWRTCPSQGVTRCARLALGCPARAPSVRWPVS
jgi:hypothetical protein